MKKFLSVCVLTAMLLTIFTASAFSVFAEEELDDALLEELEGIIEEDEGACRATYRIDWSAQSFYTYKYNETRSNDNYMRYFDVDKTSRYINSTGTTSYDGSAGGRAYFSQQMFDISDSTHYEYTFKAKNNLDDEYAGIVFGFGGGLAYIMYGSFNNTAASPNTGASEITLNKGLHEPSCGDCSTGHETSFLKVALDEDGFGRYKIVYEGYKVSVYGLTDSEANTYAQIGKSITLPSDSKIALGVYAMTETSGPNRTVYLSDCLLYAMNDAAAEFLGPYDDGSTELLNYIAKIEREYTEDDCTPATYRELQRALQAGRDLIDGWSFSSTGINKAKEQIEFALEQMEFGPTDFTPLNNAIAQFNSLVKQDYAELSYKMVEEAVIEGKALLDAEGVRQSQVNAAAVLIVERIGALTRVGYSDTNGVYTGTGESASDNSIEDLKSGCGGCGSSAAISAIVIVATIGAGVALKKKKD